MNDSTPIASTALGADPSVRAESSGVLSDFFLLTKARLSFLVVITTFVGYCLAAGTQFDWETLFYTLIGTGLVAGAAGALNQVMEVRVDRLMERTRSRPLASSRMTRGNGLALGVAMAVIGLFILAATTTYVAAYLAATTLFIYLALYTPMKRRSSWCVTIGAVSGAIPPVIGWTAVEGAMGFGAWVLFGILFAWQMPHFLSLAWVYRDQYAQAGFVMLARKDRDGTWTALQALLYSVVLLGIALLPVFAQRAGTAYLLGTLICNLAMIVGAVAFTLNRTRVSARWLFIASLLYLPVQLGLMMGLVKF